MDLENREIECLQCGSNNMMFYSGRVEAATSKKRAYAMVMPGNIMVGEDDTPEVPMAFDCYLSCGACNQMHRLEVTGMTEQSGYRTIINLRKSEF